jgi:integrase/recombinase XerD
MLPIIHKKIRKDKEKNGKCPVILQVYYNNQRKQVFTGVLVEPQFWDEKRQSVVQKCANADLYNRVIKNKYEEIEKEYFKQSLSTGSIDLNIERKESKVNFYTYGIAFFESMSNTASATYIKKAKIALEDFKEFSPDQTFKSITPQLLHDFQDYLFKKGLAGNTINGKFKRLKQVFKKAIAEGIVDKSPFGLFNPVTYKQPKRDFLTMEEIELLENVTLPMELEHIRNYFLLSCFTGMRFGDLVKFEKNKHVVSNKGVERIIISTEKTKDVVSIKLTTKVKAVIDKLNKPLPSNIHTNRLLKVISELAGLNKPLNMHKGRHSFAVNSASLGIPIEAVAKLLGHSSIRTTAIYFKLTDTKIDEYMDRWENA